MLDIMGDLRVDVLQCIIYEYVLLCVVKRLCATFRSAQINHLRLVAKPLVTFGLHWLSWDLRGIYSSRLKVWY